MEKQTPPSRIDLALTRRVVSGAFANKDYSVETAEKVFTGLDLAEQTNPAFFINNHARTRAIRVLNYLASADQMDTKAAAETIQVLEAQGPLSNLPLASTGLKMDIEQVAEYAKEETLQTLEYERVAAQLPEVLDLSPLERAAYKLDTVNSWVSEETWLRSYLSRKSESIILYRSNLDRSLKASTWAGGATAIASVPMFILQPELSANIMAASGLGVFLGGYLVEGFAAWRRCAVLQLGASGLNDPTLARVLKVSYLQELWDRGRKSWAVAVGNLDLIQSAERVHKAINI